MSEQHDKPRRILDSNLERDRAVQRMGAELKREQPVSEPFDFWSLVPADQEYPPRARWEEEEVRAQRAQRLEHAGIVPTILEEDFDSVVRDALTIETPALRNVRSWDNKRCTLSYSFGVLVLVGLKGQGKTVAGAWLLAKHGPGLYCSAEALRASFKATAAVDRGLWRRALRTRVLVIDELGREADAETADAALFDIINSRRGRAGREQLWTLLMGNLSEEAFRARYDDITVDKIEQQGAIITVRGENLRTRVVDRLNASKNAREGGEP